MKRFSCLLLLTASLAGPTTARAQGLAVGAIVGTTGLGGSVVVGVGPHVNLRGTFGWAPWDPEMTVDEVDFVAELPSFARATADFYAAGVFYLSGGMLWVTHGGEADVTGTFTGTIDLDGTEYPADQVGTLLGTFGLRQVMPYLGLGFGNPVGRRFSLGVDLGVGFGTVPTVDLSATGPIASDPTFVADLEASEADFEDDIPAVLRFYPVVSVSVSVGLGG